MNLLHRFQPPLVAILRGLSLAEVQPLGRALFDAGFRIVEVPLNRPGALDCIAALKAMAPADALVGGGTMLTPADVDKVHSAGGRLMVAPNCDAEVIRRACEHGMVAAPGVATPSEAFNALRWGAHALKIFPADMVGPAGLKAFKSVLPAWHAAVAGGWRHARGHGHLGQRRRHRLWHRQPVVPARGVAAGAGDARAGLPGRLEAGEACFRIEAARRLVRVSQGSVG